MLFRPMFGLPFGRDIVRASLALHLGHVWSPVSAKLGRCGPMWAQLGPNLNRSRWISGGFGGIRAKSGQFSAGFGHMWQFRSNLVRTRRKLAPKFAQLGRCRPGSARVRSTLAGLWPNLRELVRVRLRFGSVSTRRGQCSLTAFPREGHCSGGGGGISANQGWLPGHTRGHSALRRVGPCVDDLRCHLVRHLLRHVSSVTRGQSLCIATQAGGSGGREGCVQSQVGLCCSRVRVPHSFRSRTPSAKLTPSKAHQPSDAKNRLRRDAHSKLHRLLSETAPGLTFPYRKRHFRCRSPG